MTLDYCAMYIKKMRLNLTSFVFVFGMTLIAGSNFAHAQANGVTDDAVVIAHIGPLKNAILAAANSEALDGADLYLKAINALGGVNKRKIVLERYDDGQDPKRTTLISKEVIAKKSAIAFFMPRTSPSTEVLIAASQESAIPLVAPQPGTSAITQPVKASVFAVRPSYSIEVERAILLQHELTRTRFAFLVASDSFGNDVLAAANSKLESLKLKPMAVERVDNRAPEIDKAVKAFAQLAPEVIFLVCAGKAASQFIKSYPQTDVRPQFITLSNTSNNDFITDLGPAKRGVIVMQVLPTPFAGVTPLSIEYKAAAQSAKLPISYQAFQGYISAKLIVEGLRRAGRKPTPESLTAAIGAMEKLDLGGFILRYGPNERMGSKYVEPTMISKEGLFL